jgi:prepilin-type N-terminal cleavage/methylation domain-containing protein
MIKSSKGFTLIETMTAVFILSVGICGVLVIFPLSLKIIHSSDLTTKAVGLAQEKIEEISSDDYESIEVGTASENLSGPFNMFTRQTIVSYVDPANAMQDSVSDTGIKKIAVTISWNSQLSVGQQNLIINGLISKH